MTPAGHPGPSPPGAQSGDAEPLSEQALSALTEAARDVRRHAYAPYSGFAVGAALLGDDGAVDVGANYENASFPVGVCAERAALGAAVSSGRRRFRAIAIVTDAEPPAMPCGMCRQALYEFAPDLVVILENLQGVRQVRTLRQLLPDGVGVGSLPLNRGPSPTSAG